MKRETVGLLGAGFCFTAFLFLVVYWIGWESYQLSFYGQSRPIVETLFLLGAIFLIVFGIFFMRDQSR